MEMSRKEFLPCTLPEPALARSQRQMTPVPSLPPARREPPGAHWPSPGQARAPKKNKVYGEPPGTREAI